MNNPLCNKGDANLVFFFSTSSWGTLTVSNWQYPRLHYTERPNTQSVQ
jgi:hypothetical protein